MAPPPPSQKGKFRPKKQKKTIRPGATVEGHQQSSGPTVAFAPTASDGSSTTAPTVPQRSNFGPRGSAGRGGLGRGRAPTPQGRVFFQGGGGGEQTVHSSGAAASASKSSSSGGGTGSKTATGSATGKKAASLKGKASARLPAAAAVVDLTTEEVVGQLDVAVGGNAQESTAKKRATSKKKTTSDKSSDVMDEDYEDTTHAGRGTTSITVMDHIYTYDSDSSDEGDGPGRGSQNAVARMQPMELPFAPAAPVPMDEESSQEDDSPTGIVSSYQDEAPASSPFVNVHSNNELVPEKDSWFLVQLPTRLPPLKKQLSPEAVKSEPVMGDQPDAVPSIQPDGVPSEGETAAAASSTLSDVVTPPMIADAFDNQLTSAEPGRIGKFVVYKSGKTVLVMEGEDGKEIRMEVNEGLTCAFRQEAVAVDPKEGNFVSLGHVKKSVVVSPDMNSIMGM